MCPTQLRNIPVCEMSSERMLMPKWARQAARVLSEQQVETAAPRPSSRAKGSRERTSLVSVAVLTTEPNEKMGETVGGLYQEKENLDLSVNLAFSFRRNQPNPTGYRSSHIMRGKLV